MTARLFDVERIESVCSCGFRRDCPSDEFQAHMAANLRHVWWIEHDGVPTDRKPRVR